MRNLFIVIIFLFPLYVCGQQILKGRVTDEKNHPVPDASIFLNNTSIGTKADGNGAFQLNIPNGTYNLIVSSVGFQTFTMSVHSAQLTEPLHIQLKIKTEQMEVLVIEPYEKDGWEKWGLFFTENFIGNSSMALDCKIINKEAIKFRHSKKNNQLTAIATEPLLIENKSLGYNITLQLESFRYDFSTRYLIYIGYVYFEEMEGNKARKKKWKKQRKHAYTGSIMHFMRSVYRNHLIEEGFEIRRLRKIPNTEKQRIKSMYSNNKKRIPVGLMVLNRENPDSAAYYDKILAQPDQFDIIEKNILQGDSIAYAVDSTTAGIEFNNYLLVIYKNELAPLEYIKQYPKSSTAMMSQITLVNHSAINVEANGNYYDPTHLVSSGYWAWSEKISMMLPFDYIPD